MALRQGDERDRHGKDNVSMEKLTSADGTPIAYTVAGEGPAIVFVTGAFNDHRTCLDLAAHLAGEHRTVLYDRRARGESGDTRPYAIAREVDPSPQKARHTLSSPRYLAAKAMPVATGKLAGMWLGRL